jgi:hypothetical protein
MHQFAMKGGICIKSGNRFFPFTFVWAIDTELDLLVTDANQTVEHIICSIPPRSRSLMRENMGASETTSKAKPKIIAKSQYEIIHSQLNLVCLIAFVDFDDRVHSFFSSTKAPLFVVWHRAA